jgi:hypothetical protein
MPDLHVAFKVLLHAVNLRHGTDGFTSPPKEGVLRNFSPGKNPTTSAGFEPASAELGYQRPARYHRSRMDYIKKRLKNCIQEDGRHLTDIIFKT